MGFSVIIPTLNEELYLRDSLETITNQSEHNFEILVVDACSDDETRKIAVQMGARVILCERRNAGAQRNLGARVAKENIIVFIDADTKVSENLLEEFSRVFSSNTQVVGLFPKLVPSGGGMTDRFMFWLLRAGLTVTRLLGFPLVPGACCAYRRKPFFEAGGFAEEISRGEDSVLSLRMKKLGKIKSVPSCHAETSLRNVIKNGRGEWMKQMIISTLPTLIAYIIYD